MCDPTYLLGETELILYTVCVAIFAESISFAFIRIQDMKHNIVFLKYYNEIRSTQFKYQFYLNNNSFMIKLANLVGKLFLDILLPWALVICFSLFTFITIASYLEQDTNHPLILVILFYLIALVCFFQFFQGICLTFVFSFVISIFIGLKFKQITNKFKTCVAQNKQNFIRYNLIDLIEEHNYFTKMTADINKFSRIPMFILYYLAVPHYFDGLHILYITRIQNLLQKYLHLFSHSLESF